MGKLPPVVDVVVYAIPFAILLLVAEVLYSHRHAPQRYEALDTRNSILFGIGSNLSNSLTGGLALSAAFLVYEFRLTTIGFTALAWLACFALDDLLYYVSHVASHRVRWFWASHVNHHSSQHFNLSTSLRHSWTRFFTFSFLFRLPSVWIGFDPAMVFFCGAINLVYNFWIHTETIGKLPRPIEFIFNTPSHHRVHHAANPEYLDSNYGGVLIIWDRLFGTLREEDERCPPRYGLVKQLGTFDLLWSVFHEWIDMFRDIRSAPARWKLGYLLMPPGWRHDSHGATTRDIRERWDAARRREARPGSAPPLPGATAEPMMEEGIRS